MATNTRQQSCTPEWQPTAHGRVSGESGGTVAKQQCKKAVIRAFKGLVGSQTSQISKTRQNMVLVHFCFNQEDGESKKESCRCKKRIPRTEAIDLVRRGIADWLQVKNPKTAKLVKFTRAAVVRQTVIDGEVLWAVDPPAQIDRRSAKNENIKRTIRCDARKIFEKLLSKGLIPAKTFKVSDDELDQMFEDKEGFNGFLEKLSELGQNSLRKQLVKVIVHWWNNVLSYQKLDLNAGTYMNQADSGKGLTIYSGSARQVELVNAMAQSFALATADCRRNAQINEEPVYEGYVGKQVTGPANQRASFWSGAWDFLTGTDPVTWERPEDNEPDGDNLTLTEGGERDENEIN